MSEAVDLEAEGPFIIVTSFRATGDSAWWGSNEKLTAARGSAYHYADHAEALERARRLKQMDLINDYTVEAVTKPPRRSSTEGSSGRA